MKNLISVTPREFKRHFNEIIDECSDVCMSTNQEIAIIIPEKKDGKTYIKITSLVPLHGGIQYNYNKELLKKYGINIDNRVNIVENIISDTFKDADIFGQLDDKATNYLKRAINLAAIELIKRFNIV